MVDALADDDVDLQRKPVQADDLGDARENIVQTVGSRDLQRACGVEGIEADIEAVESRTAKRDGQFS